MVYQTLLTIPAVWMAVDAGGNVYLASNNTVEKLDADGSTVTYNTTIGQNVSGSTGIRSTLRPRLCNRICIGHRLSTMAGALPSLPGVGVGGPNAFAVRLKPTGTVDYATYLGGISPASPAGIAVDASGSAFVTGVAWTPLFPTTAGAYLSGSGIPNSSSISFLARPSRRMALRWPIRRSRTRAVRRLQPSPWTLPIMQTSCSRIQQYGLRDPAVQPARHCRVVFQYPAGTRKLARGGCLGEHLRRRIRRRELSGGEQPGHLPGTRNRRTTVLDSSGKALQSTYIPGASGFSYEPPPVGLGNNSVYVVGSSGLDSTQTQQLAGSSLQGFSLLTSLTPNLNARLSRWPVSETPPVTTARA